MAYMAPRDLLARVNVQEIERSRGALISFPPAALAGLPPAPVRDPRLPSEQPTKELMRCLMLVRKFSPSPIP